MHHEHREGLHRHAARVVERAYAVAHLDEIDVIDDGRCPFRPVRHHLGLTAFGVNAWTGVAAGDRIINEHDEAQLGDGSEELYLVLAGRARFELDGRNLDAPARTFVAVQPGVTRTAFAEEPGTTIVAVGCVPGKAYEPQGWELWAPLGLLHRTGEYSEAADRARPLAEANPQYAFLFYNLACCESLAGRTDDALDHLQQAIEKSEEFRSVADSDPDFDPIRENPVFTKLVQPDS